MKEIKLNTFQLNVLLEKEEREDYDYIRQHGVFCSNCMEVCPKGIELKDIFLNSMNDILIKGICIACGSPVNRFIEFGDDKEFFERAVQFRRSIGEDL